MLTTKRKPASVGEILVEEFMEPMGLTQGALAEAILCDSRFEDRSTVRPEVPVLGREVQADRAYEGVSCAHQRGWLCPSNTIRGGLL